jgi:hypothetical protein
MSLPVQKPKRRWGAVIGFVLIAFAGGVAAGPTLTDYAYILVEGGAAFLTTNVPWLMGKSKQAPAPPPTVHRAPSPAAPSGEPAPVAVTPPAPPSEAPAPAERPTAAAPEPAAAAPAAAEPPAARHAHGRSAAKPPAAAPAVARPQPEPAPVKKRGKGQDPFETDEGGAKAAAAPKHEPAAKAEPTPKPASRAGRSSDALDNLMADVVTETKGDGKSKGKKQSGSKDIDSMLKDVQKSEPAPVKKKEQPADLPPLAPADIARVMGKVKTRANACSQQFGGKGQAELKVTVGRDGKVSDVSVGGKVADTPTAQCIAKAVRAASFPPNAGLRFDYRIDVR